MVHSEEDLKMAEEASQILFGKGTTEVLHRMDETTLLTVFDGVPRASIDKSLWSQGSTSPSFW